MIFNTALIIIKHLQVAEYRILNNRRKNSLTIGPDPTPDHSRKPNEAAHGHHFTSQKQTHQWDMPFWGSDECRPSAPCLFFYLQSSCSVVFLSYRSVNFPYQHFLSAAYLDATELFQSWISEALQSSAGSTITADICNFHDSGIPFATTPMHQIKDLGGLLNSDI